MNDCRLFSSLIYLSNFLEDLNPILSECVLLDGLFLFKLFVIYGMYLTVEQSCSKMDHYLKTLMHIRINKRDGKITQIILKILKNIVIFRTLCMKRI